MRVISGSARGRKLHAPRGTAVRPTADRVKEAVFSILISHAGTLEGMNVLDLFAGTGSLGIEALSRGAAFASFVDNRRESLQAIRDNVASTGFSERSRILATDAAVAVGQVEAAGEAFDLVFLDPPYGKELALRTLERLGRSRSVPPGTIVVAEFAVTDTLPTTFGSLTEFTRRTYGDTSVSFLQSGHRTSNA